MRTVTLVSCLLAATVLGGCSTLPFGKKHKSPPANTEALDPGLKIAVDIVMARLRQSEQGDVHNVQNAAPEIYQLAAALMPPAGQVSEVVPQRAPLAYGDNQDGTAMVVSAPQTAEPEANEPVGLVFKASYARNSMAPLPELPPMRSLMHAVHLGSYRSAGRAFAGYAELKAKVPALNRLSPRVERVDLGPGKGVFERLKAGPLNSRAEAEAMCAQLRTKQLYCIPADFTGQEPG